MSETTNTPEPEDLQGTFVGGTFGGTPTEPQDDEPEALEAAADVEGVTDAVAPGERNEPV